MASFSKTKNRLHHSCTIVNRGQEKDVSRETAVAVVAFIHPCAVQGSLCCPRNGPEHAGGLCSPSPRAAKAAVRPQPACGQHRPDPTLAQGIKEPAAEARGLSGVHIPTRPGQGGVLTPSYSLGLNHPARGARG